jgi:hypothetical protein
MALTSESQERQKQLERFIARRHPMYDALQSHWDFLEDTYEGGRSWFASNIFRYIKEGENEFEDRLARAYRFNHTREVVDLVNKYLFKMEITRNVAEVPPSVKRFWKNATLANADISDFMKRVSNRAGVFGRCWILVDSTNDGAVRTKAEEKKRKIRTYAYIVAPQDALDMSYDEFGELNWILVREIGRDDQDPMNSSGRLIERFRLWTREFSQLFEIKETPVLRKKKIVEYPPVLHNLGVVPAIRADNVASDDLYASPSMVADVAYLDRAVANYLSNLDAIIQDQTFSQLIIPAQGLMPGEDGYNKLLEMGTKRIFTYNAEHGGKPEFIGPDVKQAEIILEIYHSLGLAGERTKEDNSKGIDNSSGVAKAYDFERVNALLAAKADSLEHVEDKLARLVALWNGEEKQVDELLESSDSSLVSYPDNFDVRGLYDEFEIAAKLTIIEAPETVRRQQMEALVDKLFPQLTQELKDKIAADLKSWPPKPVLADPASAGPTPTETLKKSAMNSASNSLVKG